MLIKKEIPLQPEDIRALKRSILPLLFFPVFLAVFFYMMGTFIFSNLGESSMELAIPWVFGGVALIFACVIGYTLWVRIIDLRDGVKEQLEGIVTNKRTQARVSRTGGQGTNIERTRERERYFLEIEGVEFKVSYRYYSKAEAGQRVILERSPRSGHIFNLKSV